MNTKKWGAPTTWNEVVRRAAGRRHYNSVRAARRLLRRQMVARLILRDGTERGYQARIARELGCHPCVISRDVLALQERARREKVCPLCGTSIGMSDDLWA